MADCSGDCGRSTHAGAGGGLLLGLVAGTILGAAGLGVWLLRQAGERRQANPAAGRRPQRSASSADFADGSEALVGGLDASEGELHDTVQRLNGAIEDVRRQLESLGTNGTAHR